MFVTWQTPWSVWPPQHECRLLDMTSKARILVVDDEPGILRFLKVALIANDFEFESAGSMQEGLKYIASDQPDIVVLDLGLPDGDGKDLIRRVNGRTCRS
jgi:two-component system, OmpR family, KDP operon response regulator KdpE